MPRRTNKIFHDEDTRKRIQAAKLIDRLHDCAMGAIELTAIQVKAIDILLSKSLPSLAMIEHQGEVTTNHVVRVPAQQNSLTQWEKDHIPPHLIAQTEH